MSIETVLIIVLSVTLAAAALVVLGALRRRGDGAASHLDEGRFEHSLAAAESEEEATRADLLAGATAARHLLEMERANRLLARLVRDDPQDGEAWLELALVASYENRFEEASKALDRAVAARSDLLESLTLHRAWLALRQGNAADAQRLFAEVEAPLETKLKTDLGTGDPVFAEWFLQAGLLWRERGDEDKARWALAAAVEAAPESRLIGAESE